MKPRPQPTFGSLKAEAVASMWEALQALEAEPDADLLHAIVLDAGFALQDLVAFMQASSSI